MKLYRTNSGPVLEADGKFYAYTDHWDSLIQHDDLIGHLRRTVAASPGGVAFDAEILAPVESQEVWAAGVTYWRSRSARIEESQDAGGGTFYDRVYSAERPELFFKAAGWRVRAHNQGIRIRADARWNVPEPELALYINPLGRIVGYTIGNDVSSRDIEGENPLYLPQAKVYDGSCALGPAVLIAEAPIDKETEIHIMIERAGSNVFSGRTALAQMRRSHMELVEYLYREMTFPHGCVLLTGTGVVPPDDFTLHSGDIVTITIPPIGTLRNMVE
ncbi:MAG: fumarylacetoacetate hydrolase family protein [bacterium]